MKKNLSNVRVLRTRKPLRLGFLPETDCAPLVVAQEMGLFRRFGLETEIQCQSSWEQLHGKLVNHELDGVHSPAMLPFLAKLGLTEDKCPCQSAMVLSLQGNAIIVSRELWERGARDAVTLREQARRERPRRGFVFATPMPLGSQYALLCEWLRTANLPPALDVRIVTVPSEQMFPMLKLGYLDGFCASEPWNSVAVQAGVGVCVTTSAQMAPMHPEKVFMVRKDFADQRADEHERLVAALSEAAAYCGNRENGMTLCELLAQPRFVNAPAECLEPGLLGPFTAEGMGVDELHGLNVFHRGRASEPTQAKAAWLSKQLFRFLRWRTRPAALAGVFRPDIYARAQKLITRNSVEPVARGIRVGTASRTRNPMGTLRASAAQN